MKLKERININYQDVDYTGNMKLSRLFDIFSNIATEHASKIGVWKDEMKYKYGWVVSKMHIEILEPIEPNEYDFSTFTGIPSKVIFPRYYHVEKNGKSIVNIYFDHTLIDLNRRMITLPKRAGIEFPINNEDVSNFCKLPNEIPNNLEYQFVEERVVRFSDVDTNQHMNNARYVEWACDLIPYDLFKMYFISEIDIYFKHEIAPGSKVKLFMVELNGVYYVKGEVGDVVCFEIAIKFNKR